MARDTRCDDKRPPAVELSNTRMVNLTFSLRCLIFIVILVSFNNLTCNGEPRKKIDVYVAGFFPIGDGAKQNIGRGVMPALNLAVQHVNAHRTILRNYKLHVVWNDTKCNTSIGTKIFFDMIKNAPKKLMLFGAACTIVTDPIVKTAKHWNITQLSYADTHPKFSTLNYPNFFRMAPSEQEFNMPRIHLLKTFNWTRIGTLFQNVPRHALAHNNLLSILDKTDEIEIVETQSFADELTDQLDILLKKDIRIIFGYFNEDWARTIFCEAFEKKLYGKNFQWIITGKYRKNWWNLTGNDDGDATPNANSKPSRQCAVNDLITALEGCIMMDLLPLSSNNVKTVSGKNISQYRSEYMKHKPKDQYSRFHGYTYDGVWAMALAIQEVGQTLRRINDKHRTNRSIQDFEYRDAEWGNMFRKALASVKFEGVTGPVQFTDNMRKGYLMLKQFQDGKEVKIGEYDGIENVLHLEKGHAIYWPGGDPPLDRTIKIVEKTRVSLRIYAVLVTISALGIIMAAIFLIINIHFRNQRYIKMSSPYLNNLIIIGCMFTYTSVILLGLDSGLTSESSFPMICAARAWVLMSGFTLAFGSMFSKTWRVHSIFTDVQLNKKVIKDYQLFIVVFVLLCIDIVLMTTWQIVDPFRRETKKIVPFMRNDVEVTPENEYCTSDNMSIFIACIYIYKGLLMIFGCFLAWETRYVSIPALNDSKYIGMSVYNVVIMCVIGVPISYILSDQQDAMYLIISVFILFCTTGTLCLVFVPKIIELKRNPQGTIDKRLVRPTLKPPKAHDSDSDISELHEQIKKAEGDREVFSRRLREKEDEVKQLVNELGEEDDAENTSHSQSPRRGSRLRSVDRLKIEGCPITETTDMLTDYTSTCSGMSQEEYVVTKSQCVSMSSFNPVITTSVHNIEPNINSIEQQQSIDRRSSSSGVGLVAPDNLPRSRVHNMASPDPTSRDVVKSVSFRLEGSDSSTIEAVPILHMSRPSSSAATSSPSSLHSPPHVLHHQPPPRHTLSYNPSSQYQVPIPAQRTHPMLSTSPQPPPGYAVPHVPPRSASAQKPYQEQYRDPGTLEREGPVYGGYGGVYVHDYGGQMIQSEQKIPQERRSSRGSVIDSRCSSRSEYGDGISQDYGQGKYIVQPFGMGASPAMVPNSGISSPPIGFSSPSVHYTSGAQIGLRDPDSSSDISQRPGHRIAADTYSLHRNIYIPLNNEKQERSSSAQGRRSSRDLTIVNNTNAPSHIGLKNSNINANISSTSSLVGEQIPSTVSRRGSEPPRPVGRNVMHSKNRSFDDLGYGNSPSQDEQMRDIGYRDQSGKGYGWRVTTQREDEKNVSYRTSSRREEEKERERETRTISRAHLRRDSFGEVVSRRSPSQDSLDSSRNKSPEIYDGESWARRRTSQESLPRNDMIQRDRIPSQESLGTMSSRGSISGSIYSVTSARSDAAATRWSRENKMPLHQHHPNPTQGGTFLNGDLSESAASTDDLAHQASREGYRELTGLHRTSSEPYYNFESLDNIPDGPLFRQFYGMGQDPRHPAYEPQTLTLGRRRNPSGYAGFGGIDGGAIIGYTHSLRGRSRATTSSVAAAIAASKARNASENALDQDIMPIFQKLLSERDRFSGRRGRDYTMSSCPNITIKCDIVEYL